MAEGCDNCTVDQATSCLLVPVFFSAMGKGPCLQERLWIKAVGMVLSVPQVFTRVVAFPVG